MSKPPRILLPALIFLFVGLAAPGCDDSSSGPTYDPDIPTEWATGVANTFLPWIPGTAFTYEGAEDVTVEVQTATRMVNGVVAIEVRDRVFEAGELVEDTFDWYAQDLEGNVWYLGEDTKEYENGVVVSTEGSWEWGTDGALPGIVMWADPAAHLGETYRQEFLEGEAEDFGKVIATGISVTVPFGSYTGCVRTLDTSGLDPLAREHKTYCPDVGLVLETQEDGSEAVELTDLATP